MLSALPLVIQHKGQGKVHAKLPAKKTILGEKTHIPETHLLVSPK